MRFNKTFVLILLGSLLAGLAASSVTVSEEVPAPDPLVVPVSNVGDVIVYRHERSDGESDTWDSQGWETTYAVLGQESSFDATGQSHPAVEIHRSVGDLYNHSEFVRSDDRVAIQRATDFERSPYLDRSLTIQRFIERPAALPGIYFQGETLRLAANFTIPVQTIHVMNDGGVRAGGSGAAGFQGLIWLSGAYSFWTENRPDLAPSAAQVDAAVTDIGMVAGEVAYQIEWTYPLMTFDQAVDSDGDDPVAVAQVTQRVWMWARDPYPLIGTTEYQRVEGPAAGSSSLTRYVRSDLTRGEVPVQWELGSEPQGIERAPAGPFHPADGSRGALPYPLSQAVADAMGSAMDPEWLSWRLLAVDPHLIGATFHSGSLDWTDLESFEWRLHFRSGDGRTHLVRTERSDEADVPVVESMGDQAPIDELVPPSGDILTVSESVRFGRGTLGLPEEGPVTYWSWGIPPEKSRTSDLCLITVSTGLKRAAFQDHLMTVHVGRSSYGPCYGDSSTHLRALALRIDRPTLQMVWDSEWEWATMGDEEGREEATPPTVEPRGATGARAVDIGMPAAEQTIRWGLPVLVTSILLYFAPALKFAGTQGLLLLPGFSRVRRDKVLENERRERIHALIVENPGITPSDLCRETGLKWGAVVHHLFVLEANDILTSRIEGRHRRFFVTAEVPAHERDAQALLANPGVERVFSTLVAEPGLASGELAERIGVTPPGALYHLQRLESNGLVERRREGRWVRYYPAGAPRRYDPDEAMEIV